MRIKLLVASLAIMLPLTVFAQSATSTLPNAGILPGSPLYFLDRISEFFQEVFTFNPQAKARLQIRFASEHVAEIKVLIAKKGVSAPGLDVASVLLKDNLSKAADFVAKEKANGVDVADVAKEISAIVNANQNELEDAYRPEKAGLASQLRDLRNKIDSASNTGDVSSTKRLKDQLDGIKSRHDDLITKVDDDSKAFDDADSKLHDQMDLQSKAVELVKEAEAKRQELTAEAAGQGVDLTQNILGPIDDLLANAKAELAKGNYQSAAQLAENAMKAMHRAKEAVENEDEVKRQDSKSESSDEKDTDGVTNTPSKRESEGKNEKVRAPEATGEQKSDDQKTPDVSDDRDNE